jgi:hypothetical protein
MLQAPLFGQESACRTVMEAIYPDYTDDAHLIQTNGKLDDVDVDVVLRAAREARHAATSAPFDSAPL